MQRCCCCEDFRLWCSQNVVFQGAGSLAKSAAEREGGFSEFSYLQSLFLHSSGKCSLQKRQPNGPRLSTEKQVRHFFRSLSDMPFYLKCSETRFQIHHLTSLCEKKA